MLVSNPDDHPNGVYAATWILVGTSDAFAAHPEIEGAGRVLPPAKPEISGPMITAACSS